MVSIHSLQNPNIFVQYVHTGIPTDAIYLIMTASRRKIKRKHQLCKIIILYLFSAYTRLSIHNTKMEIFTSYFASDLIARLLFDNSFFHLFLIIRNKMVDKKNTKLKDFPFICQPRPFIRSYSTDPMVNIGYLLSLFHIDVTLGQY